MKEAIEKMARLLTRIAYPRRGTPDEKAGIQYFADEIQGMFSLGQLDEIIEEEEMKS